MLAAVKAIRHVNLDRLIKYKPSTTDRRARQCCSDRLNRVVQPVAVSVASDDVAWWFGEYGSVGFGDGAEHLVDLRR